VAAAGAQTAATTANENASNAAQISVATQQIATTNKNMIATLSSNVEQLQSTAN